LCSDRDRGRFIDDVVAATRNPVPTFVITRARALSPGSQ
jgi:hypothetical protein